MADESIAAGLAATERLKHRFGIEAAAKAEHRVAETPTRFADLRFVLQPNVFKGAKGVSAQHFGPLVGVVTRRVATGKDVAKGAEEGVIVDRREHRGAFSDLAAQFLGALAASGMPLAVQP